MDFIIGAQTSESEEEYKEYLKFFGKIPIEIDTKNMKVTSVINYQQEDYKIADNVIIKEKYLTDFSNLAACNKNKIASLALELAISGIEPIFGKYYVTTLNVGFKLSSSVGYIDSDEDEESENIPSQLYTDTTISYGTNMFNLTPSDSISPTDEQKYIDQTVSYSTIKSIIDKVITAEKICIVDIKKTKSLNSSQYTCKDLKYFNRETIVSIVCYFPKKKDRKKYSLEKNPPFEKYQRYEADLINGLIKLTTHKVSSIEELEIQPIISIVEEQEVQR